MKKLIITLALLVSPLSLWANHWNLECDGGYSLKINNSSAQLTLEDENEIIYFEFAGSSSAKDEAYYNSQEEGMTLVSRNINFEAGIIPMFYDMDFKLETAGEIDKSTAETISCRTIPVLGPM